MKRTLALLALTSLGLVACGDGKGDVSPEVFKEALIAQGLDEATSECVTNSLSDELSEDDFSQVALAQDLADLTPELEETATAAITACVLGE
jgi:hypothetical protein